jgi:hypothetical protein
VIFLTDGVANHFLNPTGNPAGFGWSTGDTPECQIGLTNTNPQIERPITAMVTEGAELKKTGFTIHVIALAGVNAIGMLDVLRNHYLVGQWGGFAAPLPHNRIILGNLRLRTPTDIDFVTAHRKSELSCQFAVFPA